jgi:adenylate kinase
MRKLNRFGDTEIQWNPAEKETVRRARLVFDQHVTVERGMAFEVGDPREPAEVIRKFNPEAQEIVLAPRMVGG